MSPRLTLGETRSTADAAVLEAGQPEAARAPEEAHRFFKAFVSDSWDK